MLHLVDRFVTDLLGEAPIPPVVTHLGVDEVLVDRRQLTGEHVVEHLEDVVVASHASDTTPRIAFPGHAGRHCVPRPRRPLLAAPSLALGRSHRTTWRSLARIGASSLGQAMTRRRPRRPTTVASAHRSARRSSIVGWQLRQQLPAWQRSAMSSIELAPWSISRRMRRSLTPWQLQTTIGRKVPLIPASYKAAHIAACR